MSIIGIIDYGMGNILSVQNALEYLGAKVKVCNHPEGLAGLDRLILPGVGAFGDCINNLKTKGFVDALNDFVVKRGRPIYGICLGMQVMAKMGYESGKDEGLGWFDAEVVRLTPSNPKLRIPHVGWNNVTFRKKCDVFKDLPDSPDVYFVHSYYMKCNNEGDLAATFDYEGSFTAAVLKNNIVASQFHPEKSQDYGIVILKNFLDWNP